MEVYSSSETSVTIYLLTQSNNTTDLNIEKWVVWMGQGWGQIQWWASIYALCNMWVKCRK